MPKIDLFGGKRSLMLVTPLKERERRSTWKDGGKDTPVIQFNTAFFEIDDDGDTNHATHTCTIRQRVLNCPIDKSVEFSGVGSLTH